MDMQPGQFGVTLGHEPANPKPLQKGGQPSQGTLFRQPKPTAEHRYAAKGYTPERQAAIAAAIPTKNVGVSSIWSHSSGVFPTIEEAGDTKRQRAWTRRALVDVYARSTAPLEDIQRNTPKVKVRQMPTSWGQMQVWRHKITGEPMQGELRLDPGGGPERPRGKTEKTALHELGHHVDFESDPAGFFRTGRTERMMARRPGEGLPSSEGAAEGYAARHWVPRRNEPAGSREYKDVATYQDLHQRPAFRRRFEQVSGRPLEEAMGHLGPQFHQTQLFHGPTEGGRVVHTWGHETKLTDVGTIKVGA